MPAPHNFGIVYGTKLRFSRLIRKFREIKLIRKIVYAYYKNLHLENTRFFENYVRLSALNLGDNPI